VEINDRRKQETGMNLKVHEHQKINIESIGKLDVLEKLKT
jgi:hypothetical protein